MSGCVILILVIPCTRSLNNFVKFHKSVLIKFLKFIICNHILIGVKIIKIAETISCGVSDFSVVIRNLFKNFRADTNICVIICACNPKTKNVCAVFINNLLRSDTVTERFRHFSALAVNSPAVSDNLLIRCSVACCNRGKK